MYAVKRKNGIAVGNLLDAVCVILRLIVILTALKAIRHWSGRCSCHDTSTRVRSVVSSARWTAPAVTVRPCVGDGQIEIAIRSKWRFNGFWLLCPPADII